MKAYLTLFFILAGVFCFSLSTVSPIIAASTGMFMLVLGLALAEEQGTR